METFIKTEKKDKEISYVQKRVFIHYSYTSRLFMILSTFLEDSNKSGKASKNSSDPKDNLSSMSLLKDKASKLN